MRGSPERSQVPASLVPPAKVVAPAACPLTSRYPRNQHQRTGRRPPNSRRGTDRVRPGLRRLRREQVRDDRARRQAHGLRVEPIIAALTQARLSGFVPMIGNEDAPPRRAPGEFAGRAKIEHVVPIMSGKGGVGKSLVTALLAIGLRRKQSASASSTPTSPDRRSPNSSACTQPLRSKPIRRRRRATAASR